MKEGEISLSLKFKKAMDGWNNTFITGDPSHLPNIVTDDFVCRPTEGNENLAQVLEWATNTSSVLGDYKVIHEDERSLCGFIVWSAQKNLKSGLKWFICCCVTPRWPYTTATKLCQIK